MANTRLAKIAVVARPAQKLLRAGLLGLMTWQWSVGRFRGMEATWTVPNSTGRSK